MKKWMLTLCLLSPFSILYPLLPVFASEILLDDYRDGLSPRWEERIFEGRTRYEVTEEDHERCIKAISRSSASALQYRIRYDPKAYPLLKWRWKVRQVISKGDASKKEGDDYAARIYVAFPSLLFWDTVAINYIWANRLPRGEVVVSPFTSNSMMIAVESGSAHAGEWREETRNVLEDYRRVFGRDPPEVGAIAIMTDTDNTGEEAVAWYGPIRILSVAGP